MKKLIITITTIILCLSILYGCSNSNNVQTGQKYTLTADGFMGKTKQDLDDGLSYVKANNSDAFQKAVSDGRIIELRTGDEVTVNSLNGTTVQVQDSVGDTGYMTPNILK